MENELREQGLKKLMKIYEITEGDIEVAGRLSRLEGLPEVKSIVYPPRWERGIGSVYLKQDKTNSEIMGMMERVGFSNLRFTRDSELAMNINDVEYTIDFYQPEEADI